MFASPAIMRCCNSLLTCSHSFQFASDTLAARLRAECSQSLFYTHFYNVCVIVALWLIVLCAHDLAATMSDRERDRDRLNALGRVTYVTHRGLASLLAQIKQQGIPEHTSRSAQSRALNNLVDTETPYGKILQTMSLRSRTGSTVDITVQAPLAMLSFCASERAPFARLLDTTLQRWPSSHETPWDLIIYADEVVPNNVLKHENFQRVQAIYLSFLQFGPAVLSNEQAWFVITTVRSNLVAKLDGGMSFVVHRLLRDYFFNDRSHNMQNGGAVFNLHGEDGKHVMIFAKVRILVSDEKAIKEIYLCKGSSGTKVCVGCRAVVLDSELAAHDASNYLQPMSQVDPALWHMHTDESLRATYAHVASRAGTLGITALKEFTKNIGFNFSGNAMLLDNARWFRPAHMLMWDWMHCYIVGGIFNKELGLLMTAAREFDVTYEHVHAYMGLWVWPHRVRLAHTCFNAKRAKSNMEAGTFKASASESLAVYPIVARFIVNTLVKENVCERETRSFLALCDVLDNLLSVSRCRATPADLRRVITVHTDAFIAAYGGDALTPKHHYALHLPLQFEAHGTLIACFTHERKHRMVKRFAGHINSRQHGFERSAMAEVTAQHLYDLAQQNVFHADGAFFEAVKPATKQLRDFMRSMYPAAIDIVTADVADGRFGAVYRGDVACLLFANGAMSVADVWCHVIIDGEQLSCVSVWPIVGAVATCGTFRIASTPQLVRTIDVAESVVYSKTGDVSTVIIPPSLRV